MTSTLSSMILKRGMSMWCTISLTRLTSRDTQLIILLSPSVWLHSFFLTSIYYWRYTIDKPIQYISMTRSRHISPSLYFVSRHGEPRDSRDTAKDACTRFSHSKKDTERRLVCSVAYGKKTEHHLVPRVRLRDASIDFLPHNTLRLYEIKHSIWHQFFGNLTINEIISLFKKPISFDTLLGTLEWQILFGGNKTRNQALALLVRMRRIVRKQFVRIELNYNPDKHDSLCQHVHKKKSTKKPPSY